MIQARGCLCLFIFVFLANVVQILPTLHGQNHAFVQDDNDVQYLLDSLPVSIHKAFGDSVHGTGDAIDENGIQSSLAHIEFEPNVLDFKERQLGVPHQQTVTLFNRDDNRTIHLSSITGLTQHFHSSFFQDKVIPPLGNTTFSVVFLGREEGEIDSYLFIHTSDGTLKYQVKGTSVSSPYRLQPVLGVKLPINASFTPLIYMHNPYSEPMQVTEIYSSGVEFDLGLPNGQTEGPRELWEILPYQTKPIIRLHFNAYTEKNHTAYIRFRSNKSAEVLIVAVEIEVSSGAGLHWGDNSGLVNFGMGGSHQSPTTYQIALKNSAKKPIKVQNIVSTPSSKALKVNFEPIVIPGETETPMVVGTLVYDWKTGLQDKHFRGKLLIKGIGPGGSSQKLAIPWVVEVLQGGLEVNTSAAHYCSPHSNRPRNFSVVNKFKLPLAITNVSLSSDAAPLFKISNFIPKVLKSGQRDDIFTLAMKNDKLHDDLQLESSILIQTNVSTTEIPLLSYNGKLHKIIPGEKESDKGTLNFGTISSGTENESIFALENQNPVSIDLHGWGVNIPGAVLELMGCQSGPTTLFNKGVRNISSCSVTSSQSIKPRYLAIFKIKVNTPQVEEDAIIGDVFIKTNYEKLTIPVYMRVADGRIAIQTLTFTDCFPGTVCLQEVNVHSTFAQPMEVTFVSSLNKDDRVKYVPLNETSNSIISKGDNHIGSIMIDPLVSCNDNCYIGLPLNSSAGKQWLNTISLPSHTRDSDLNLLNTLYSRFSNTTSVNSWENITMQLDTSEVRGHKFSVDLKPAWPSLLVGMDETKNKSVLAFPLTQVGNTTYKNITLHNPTMHVLIVHLVMDWTYPQGSRFFQFLPDTFKPGCPDCPGAVQGEFKLSEDAIEERERFEEQWGIGSAAHSLPLLLKANETRNVRLSYTPSADTSSSALLYLRNNMTILEVIRLVGQGAYAHFKFENRQSDSEVPLLFELTDQQLKACENFEGAEVLASLRVRRSFQARNTGQLPIEVSGFAVNGIDCGGYGFHVIDCKHFRLEPNTSRRIDITYTSDLSLAYVERELQLRTSLAPDEAGLVRVPMLASLPSNRVEACSQKIPRPTWEPTMNLLGTILCFITIGGAMTFGTMEADRRLREALNAIAHPGPLQPTLDLRLIGANADKSSTQKSSPQASQSRSNAPSRRSQDPDKNSQSVVRAKNSPVSSSNKRNLSTEMRQNGSKAKTKLKQVSRPQNSEEETSSITTECSLLDERASFKDTENIGEKFVKGQKKNTNKKSKPQTSIPPVPTVDFKENVELNGDGEYLKKDSPENQNKWKINSNRSTNKLTQQQTTISTVSRPISEPASKLTRQKSNPSKKDKLLPSKKNQDKAQTKNDNKDVIFEKSIHLESPMEIGPRVSVTSLTNGLSIKKDELKSTASALPNTSIFTATAVLPATSLLSATSIVPTASVLPATFALPTTSPTPLAPLPPLSRWENRAKFSDVVARNPDNSNTFANNCNLTKVSQSYKNAISSPTSFGTEVPFTNGLTKRNSPQEFLFKGNQVKSKSLLGDKNGISCQLNLVSPQDGTQLNNYFSNACNSLSATEPELIPFDFTDADEPRFELENASDNNTNDIWRDNSIINNINDNPSSQFQAQSLTSENVSNATESLQVPDNWSNVDTNWQPQYPRAAVGEGRSGASGNNPERVWSTSWGDPAAPYAQSPVIRPVQINLEEQEGFDPFRSLSSIWTPNSTEPWIVRPNQE
uniref:Transmembrane protein 131-like N-terminal domain-containing protein n=1 Tax=Trichogramma kaykai TaxID=54128 RepID=A0ABD2W8B9_9HYME